MTTQYVDVPMDGNNNEIEGWIENISQYIDAGKDVEFRNRLTGLDTIISQIQLDSAGTVSIFGKNDTKSDAKAIYLVAGEFHCISGIHGIEAANTSKSIGIHVKI